MRQLTAHSTLENLQKEAKRWLKALRAGDDEARARLHRSIPDPPPTPILRDVQHALAREHGLSGWVALKEAVALLHPPTAGPDDVGLAELLAAAAGGDLTRIAAVLDRHPALIDRRGQVGGHSGARTALHFAVSGPHREAVALLLDRGADPNIRDEGDDAMPLHFVAEREDLDLIKLLIEHGADPIGAGTHHQLDVLGWATCFGTGRREVVDYLLASGAHYTIFSAVAMGEVNAVRDLIERDRSDLERRMDATNRHRTPLHLAVVKRQPAVAAALLTLGADPDAVDLAGLTPLDQAALDGQADLVEALLAGGARITLAAAVALDRPDAVDRHLRAEPRALEPGGRFATLIVRAAEHGSARLIESLVRNGASVDVRDETETAVDNTVGYTPLHAAAFHGNEDAAAALVRLGANLNARESRYGGTPAGWANYAGHRALRDRLLAGPIDLFEAVDFNLVDRVPEILGRDPAGLERRFGEVVTPSSQAEEWGRWPWMTPLVMAVRQGREEMVRELLARGANRDLRAPDGRSLVEIARAGGQGTIASLLEEGRA